MSKQKNPSPKQPSAASRAKLQAARLAKEIRKKIADSLQAQADRVRALPDGPERELVLRDLVRTGQASRPAGGAGATLSPRCLEAVLRELASGIRASLRQTKVAFLGPLHSFSHLATLRHFGSSAELLPVRTIPAVFEEVNSGQADAGVVPIENSTDGRIVDTLDMFTRCRVKIRGEVPLRIHHHLLGMGKRDEIVEVCSKPQAISQCREWLANHLPDAKVTPTSSTTVAAERASNDSSVAAIASRQAAAAYGLGLLAENIEDNAENITRFAVIAKESATKTAEDKTSLMFELSHQPGALADAMAIFKRQRLNLTWIESFPKPGSPKEYLFFVELMGHQQDLRVRKALTSLAKKTVSVEVLGSYPLVAPVD